MLEALTLGLDWLEGSCVPSPPEYALPPQGDQRTPKLSAVKAPELWFSFQPLVGVRALLFGPPLRSTERKALVSGPVGRKLPVEANAAAPEAKPTLNAVRDISLRRIEALQDG